MPVKLQSQYNRVWTKKELVFINVVKAHPVLYARKKLPTDEPLSKVWKKVAMKMNMTVPECKSRWHCWKKQYISLRKQQLNGVIFQTMSKFLNGQLSFLDDEIGEIINLKMKKGIKTKEKTVTVLTVNTINQLLKDRNDDPDIDSATLQYLFNILTDRIEIALKSNTNTSKTSQIVDTTQTAKSNEIRPTTSSTKDNSLLTDRLEMKIKTPDFTKVMENTQTSIVNPVETYEYSSEHRKLIVRQPDTINMDSLISCIATKALQDTNSGNRNITKLESILLNKEQKKVSQEFETQPIDIDDDEIDATENLPSPSNSCDDDQLQIVESNTVKSTENEDFDTVFDLHCSRKDPRLFFKDLAEYIIEKFSAAKQKEIRLKICSVVTEAELEEME